APANCVGILRSILARAMAEAPGIDRRNRRAARWLLGAADIRSSAGIWSGGLCRGAQSHKPFGSNVPGRTEIRRRPRSGRDAKHAPGDCHLPDWRIGRTLAARRGKAATQGVGDGCCRRAVAGPRMGVVAVVSGDQEAVDLFVRPRGYRLVRDAARLILLDHRDARLAPLGGTVRMDRSQSDHYLCRRKYDTLAKDGPTTHR